MKNLLNKKIVGVIFLIGLMSFYSVSARIVKTPIKSKIVQIVDDEPVEQAEPTNPEVADLAFDGPIINSTGRDIIVSWSSDNTPIVKQSYELDQSVVLTYILRPGAGVKDSYKFPQDFLLEVPNVFLNQHKDKRLDQITVLGSHNCFANKAEGFLYFQQIPSSKDQFVKGGVRMLRPAWHNPSGSFMDKPNDEPILCHSDDDKCATVSLATRGFRPHRVVKELNQTIKDLLREYPDQYLIVGINNYLTAEQTENEIEKITGLASMVIRPSDVANKKNQKEWGGRWPTLDWMCRKNKRILFFDDRTTTYTFSYEDFVSRNQYGTVVLERSANFRPGKPRPLPHAITELSWFQDISLNPADQRAIEAGIKFYQSMRDQVGKLTLGGSWLLSSSAYALKQIGFPIEFFEQSMSFSRIATAINFTTGKFAYLGTVQPFKYIFDSVASYKESFSKAVSDIKNYMPEKQDNSVQALFNLCQACRKSGVLLPDENPNIIMLDFSTTEGQGLLAVNILNVLMDQRLGLQFVGLGGFAIDGKQVVFPVGFQDNQTFVW
ncbi:MAG: hypothetical protein NTU89_02070 [Candidatus Dependentiae bacterium]|nr:hypothetical protein [Candidatus Dependentiae bacterium]